MFGDLNQGLRNSELVEIMLVINIMCLKKTCLTTAEY